VVLADFNGDGVLDAATANYTSGGVSVLLGNGDGTFGTRTDYPTGSNPWDVAAGDLNGDGRADLVVANYSSGTLSLLLGNGQGGFTLATNLVVGANPRSVALGDLNSDGRLDIVALNPATTPCKCCWVWGAAVLPRRPTSPPAAPMPIKWNWPT